jgi:coenzyme F420-reducing hydrogenase alpha subunit
MEIRVDHVTRVEGHGNILAALEDGQVKQALFQVVEANRFFEGFLRGRDWEEVGHVATRICGICAVSHCYASLQATEAALGIQVSDQTRLLRRLTINAEQISSHALHVYFLAAPDFLRLQSVLPLIKQDPDTVLRAFRLKKTGYDLGEMVLGRHCHPISAIPGGFTALPKLAEVRKMKDRLVGLRPDLEATIVLCQKLEIPAFERETEYVSLRHPDHYAWLGGEIVSSDGGAVPAERYREAITEFVVPHSTAKHARWHRDAYRVGALARINNNWQQLRPEAKQAMSALGLNPPLHNPFLNTVAQVVELVHCVEDSIAACDEIIARGLEDEPFEVKPRAGRGVAAVEAPRGLLVHEYEYDQRGRCQKANCIIPTAQNYANLDREMQALLPQIADLPKEEIQLKLEMLVRAYDPCISCSVH